MLSATAARNAAATLIAGIGLLSAAASANTDPFRIEPYVGGNLGAAGDASSYDFGPGSTVTREIGTAFGGHAFAGVKFGRFIGIELSRLQLGDLGSEARTPGGPVDAVRAIGVTSLNLAGFLPLGERWELTGRLGLALDASYSTGQTCYQRSGRFGYIRSYPCQSTSYVVGAGARYALNEDWGLRLDWLYVDFQDSREGPNYQPHYLGIGADYRF
jgi:opacity protein-like surface antigen